MRQSEKTIQHRLDEFNAIFGNVSKTDLKVMASAVMQLQGFFNYRSVEMLRNLQVYLSCHFILLNPPQKQEAIETIQLLHNICNELQWQHNYGASLLD